MCDRLREAGLDVTLLHGEEDGREIGKPPKTPANWVEIDLLKPTVMEVAAGLRRRRR